MGNTGGEPRRGRKMDEALYEALETAVPHKDTGPDPDDILSDLIDEEQKSTEDRTGIEGDERVPGGSSRTVTIALDAAAARRAEEIMQAVRSQTGLQIELGEAVNIALWGCALSTTEIIEAYQAICASRSASR